MYRQVLIPDKKNHSVEMPKQFYGKKVEVIVVEIDESAKGYPAPPAGKKTQVAELLESFGASPDFPTIDEIRAKAWTSKW